MTEVEKPAAHGACANCGSDIEASDLERSLAVRIGDRLICPQCVDALPLDTRLRIERLRLLRGVQAPTYRFLWPRHPDLSLYTFTTSAAINRHRHLVHGGAAFDPPTITSAQPPPLPTSQRRAWWWRPALITAGVAIIFGLVLTWPRPTPKVPIPTSPVPANAKAPLRSELPADPLAAWTQVAGSGLAADDPLLQSLAEELETAVNAQLRAVEATLQDGGHERAQILLTAIRVPDHPLLRHLERRRRQIVDLVERTVIPPPVAPGLLPATTVVVAPTVPSPPIVATPATIPAVPPVTTPLPVAVELPASSVPPVPPVIPTPAATAPVAPLVDELPQIVPLIPAPLTGQPRIAIDLFHHSNVAFIDLFEGLGAGLGRPLWQSINRDIPRLLPLSSRTRHHLVLHLPSRPDPSGLVLLIHARRPDRKVLELLCLRDDRLTLITKLTLERVGWLRVVVPLNLPKSRQAGPAILYLSDPALGPTTAFLLAAAVATWHPPQAEDLPMEPRPLAISPQFPDLLARTIAAADNQATTWTLLTAVEAAWSTVLSDTWRELAPAQTPFPIRPLEAAATLPPETTVVVLQPGPLTAASLPIQMDRCAKLARRLVAAGKLPVMVLGPGQADAETWQALRPLLTAAVPGIPFIDLTPYPSSRDAPLARRLLESLQELFQRIHQPAP